MGTGKGGKVQMTTTMDAVPTRPIPLADEVSRPFWAAAREGRLEIQRCRACGHWNHAPGLACQACGSEELGFEPVSGRGKLYSWAVLREPPAAGFRDMLPLIVGLVELAEQPHLLMVANIQNIDESALRLDLPLRVCFEWLAPDCAVPQFTPAGEA